MLVRPTLESVSKLLASTNNSCAGPDGIPYAIYRALSSYVCPIFLDLFNNLAEGGRAPPGFNEGILFLLEKKDTFLIKDTRPISVTNADNRFIARMLVASIDEAVSNLIGPAQTGFLRGRLIDRNIVGVNDEFYNALADKVQYYLLSLDMERAFDTINHDWIHTVLKRLGFPSWVTII